MFDITNITAWLHCLTHQYIKHLLPKPLMVVIENVKETVECVLKKLDHLITADVAEVGEDHAQVLLLLTPL